jgi:hypothetical protein
MKGPLEGKGAARRSLAPRAHSESFQVRQSRGRERGETARAEGSTEGVLKDQMSAPKPVLVQSSACGRREAVIMQ